VSDESNQSKTPGSGVVEVKPLIEYPTVYAFKVMGKLEHGFAEYIRQKFSRLMGSEVSQDSISENVSKQGHYVSLTVSVYLLSEEQRQTIYADIHNDKRIVYYL
jgi:putative lipoic acid-binding regulatory protein